MLTGYSASQLLGPVPGSLHPSPGPREQAEAATPAPQLASAPAVTGMAGVEAVFASRSEFASRVELRALLDGVGMIGPAGLSLNLICQQVPDQYLVGHLARGNAAHLLGP